MSYVLTDDELAKVLRNRFTTEGDARAIERAVVAKLTPKVRIAVLDYAIERIEKAADIAARDYETHKDSYREGWSDAYSHAENALRTLRAAVHPVDTSPGRVEETAECVHDAALSAQEGQQ